MSNFGIKNRKVRSATIAQKKEFAQVAKKIGSAKCVDLGIMTIQEYLQNATDMFNEKLSALDSAGDYYSSTCQVGLVYIGKIKDRLDYNASQYEEKFIEFRKRKTYKSDAMTQLETKYDFSGDHVDVGRFLSGEPECMVDFIGNGIENFVEIKCRFAAVGSDTNLFGLYASILDYIDYLENNGARVRFIAQIHHESESRKKFVKGQILLKDYNEILSIRDFSNIILPAELSSLVFYYANVFCGVTCYGIDKYGDPTSLPSNTLEIPSLHSDSLCYQRQSDGFYNIAEYAKSVGYQLESELL